MNEELRLAIEQLRLMPLNRRWFIPIMLEPSTIPDFPIDATDSLSSLHYIDFSADWHRAMAQLVYAISSSPQNDINCMVDDGTHLAVTDRDQVPE